VPQRLRVLLVSTLLVLLAALCVTPPVPVVATPLPDAIDDRAFWQMIDDFSEPNGYFRSDNLVSNETAFQHVIPELQKRAAPAGVYLGVGPDQNFTYIVALQPRIAFIVDVRRQNMLLHLMYKALIELSADRAEFLSRLFARPRPDALGPHSTAEDLFSAYSLVLPDQRLLRATLDLVVDRLVVAHGFHPKDGDIASLEYVYRAFVDGGPNLRYAFQSGGAGFTMAAFPTFADLILESDTLGAHHSYLASEENFAALRALELANLIVPVVGDFGGPRALRAVGGYLRAHGASVTAFYTSNVEQYLFQNGGWRRFFANVAALPLDGGSLFVRAYFAGGGFRGPLGGGLRSTTLLDSMPDAVAAFSDGHIRSYRDVIERSWAP